MEFFYNRKFNINSLFLFVLIFCSFRVFSAQTPDREKNKQKPAVDPTVIVVDPNTEPLRVPVDPRNYEQLAEETTKQVAENHERIRSIEEQVEILLKQYQETHQLRTAQEEIQIILKRALEQSQVSKKLKEDMEQANKQFSQIPRLQLDITKHEKDIKELKDDFNITKWIYFAGGCACTAVIMIIKEIIFKK